MEGLLQILVLASFLVAGAILPSLRFRGGRGLAPPAGAVDLCAKVALWTLLAAMGFRMGNDPSLAPRLAEIGLLAATIAVFAVLGTLIAILLGSELLAAFRDRLPRCAESRGPAESGVAYGANAAPRGLRRFRAPALLLALVAAGFLLGLALPPLGLDLGAATSWILNALLFFIGMQFARSGISLKRAFFDPRALMTPIATALGSLAGGLAAAPLFGLGAGKAMALAGGFGWYSLSGVLIADLGDPALGSAAFLANMIRESIALVSIPFLASGRRPELAIGVGGATAMDVTLPLVERCAGPGLVPVSFASGALLSLAVPLIVPLLYRLG